jgi:DNA polymerase III subunit gamma/tau
MEQNFDKNDSYLVLARRTRPQSFSELIGQTSVTTAIENILDSKKIPHAFLLTGTRGTGKTSSARILAKSLCCEAGPTKHPCQTCVHCTQITSSSHDDILEIDGASNTGVDHIRELRESTRFYPHSSKYKIFIIDEVHMLSTGAFNALLKTLEEPLPQVIFILATTELHKVPITVRSRCMIFSFKKIEQNIIEQHLKNILQKENVTFEDEAIQIVAREAKGSLRDSLSLMEQAIAICGGKHLSFIQTKEGLCVQGEDLSNKLFSAICEKNISAAFEVLKQADLANFDISTLMENTSLLFRHAMIIKSLNDKERSIRLTHLLPSEYDFLAETSQNLTSAALSEIFKTISMSIKEISRTNTPLSWSEVVVMDCISRSEWLSASEMFALLAEAPPATKQSPSPQKESRPVDQKSKIDLDLYKKFIHTTKRKSDILSTKLSHAKIEQFNQKTIQFSDLPDNATYLSFNDQDSLFFWESLKEIGLDSSELKGKYVPNKPASNQAATLNQVAQNLNKFTHIQITPPASIVSERTNSISLSEINHNQKMQEKTQKENKILSLEHVQNLKKLATEIKILSKE